MELVNLTKIPAYDIFLPCAPKDTHKLKYVLKGIYDNVKDYDRIFICSPNPIPAPEVPADLLPKMRMVLDGDTLPGVDRSGWKFRPNWCFQQHLKMFQKFTHDWWLTIDCDTIINRKFDVFNVINENKVKPIFYKGKNQCHPPYFAFQGYMIDIGRICTRSYISDTNLFFRPILMEMLVRNGYTIQSFIQKSQKITDKYCHIAEPELYGSYVQKYHGDFYDERFLNMSQSIGKIQRDVNEKLWTDEQIQERIAEMKSIEVDTYSMHSWLKEVGEND